MTLRDKISATILECVEIDDAAQEVRIKVSEATPTIIALFRDALLSDKAIKAGNNMLPSYDQDTDASDVIMAALDTITND